MIRKGNHMNRIKSVDKGSIAEELEIEVGDILLTINEQPVVDIIDYMFLTNDEVIEIEIQKPDGEIWAFDIEKEYDESLGIEFENPIIDHAKRCTNSCVFCFIDQLPKGMRESLYFKDDDSRLSFLQGNFVTLTNLKDDDINRIIRYRISPINVSVHTTDPELRKKMLGNRFAGNIMERLKQLCDGGITVNAQIVLCPGYNNGEALTHTLMDLMTLAPNLNSVAIVPIGLTRHREGLIYMEAFNQETASETIQRVKAFQEVALSKLKSRFAFLADEFYIKAEVDFPSDEEYEDYIQLEDGVGMIRKLMTEVDFVLSSESTSKVKSSQMEKDKRQVRSALVTGVAAAPYLEQIAQQIEVVYPYLKIDVIAIQNEFFGERITVSGLITGIDIMKQAEHLKMKSIDQILLPSSMFRAEEEVLLDDVTLTELQTFFNIPVIKVATEGHALIKQLLYGGTHA